MKKILTLFLVVCMLLSAIPMAVSAEEIHEPQAPNAPENITTVYVSNTGSDSTEDGTKRETPFLTFNAAYKNAVEISGTADRKIVVLNDVDAFSSTDTLLGYEAAHYLMEDYDNGTIYVCGESNNAENVPYIDFEYKTGTTYWTCAITLGADMVFNNIGFDSGSTTTKKNIWICAALHDLTLGYGIEKKCGTLAVNGTVFKNITDSTEAGTEAREKINAQMDATANDTTTISIYSGEYGGAYAGNRSNKEKCDYAPVTCITLNLFGGSYSGHISAFNGGSGKNVTVNKKLTVNVYDVQLASGKKMHNENASAKEYAYLNLYNANLQAQIDSTNFKEVNKCYAVYVGVQNTTVDTKDTEATTDDTYDVRFVGVVNSLEYSKVGFEITTDKKDKKYGAGEEYCKSVYTSIVGEGEGTYTAEQLGGNFIFAFAIYDIPTSVGAVTFTVTPYVVKDGVTYYGASYTVTYNAGEHVSSAAAN